MAATLNTSWAPDRRYSAWVVLVAARQGRRNTGGTWTRPDIVLVATRRFAHVPGTHLDVVTFEVKPPDFLDVTAVYEALAHKQRAHASYVLAHLPDGSDPPQSVRETAERHGIGLVAATDPVDYSTWAELVRPERVQPNLELLDEFIAVQLGDAHPFLRESLAHEAGGRG